MRGDRALLVRRARLAARIHRRVNLCGAVCLFQGEPLHFLRAALLEQIDFETLAPAFNVFYPASGRSRRLNSTLWHERKFTPSPAADPHPTASSRRRASGRKRSQCKQTQ